LTGAAAVPYIEAVSEELTERKTILFIQSIAILALMAGVLIFSGLHILGVAGVVVIVAGGIFIYSAIRRQSELAKPMNIKKIDRAQAPGLYEITDELAEKAGLPEPPTLYLLPVDMLNAASMYSRGKPVVVVTPTLTENLSERELHGILAHEVSHISENDLLFYRLAQVIQIITITLSRVAWLMLILYFPILFASNVQIPPSVLGVLIIAPIASVLLQLALSRSREFRADLGAVELTGDPEGLARGLERIDNIQSNMLRQILPMPRRDDQGSSILRSHPAVSKRVAVLRELEHSGSASE
jgi:heat shock protein HtpX